MNLDMKLKIDKLKHFHVENYSGTNFTDDLNDGEVGYLNPYYRSAYNIPKRRK